MPSFTARYSKIVDKLINKVEVKNSTFTFRCDALWDTGATCTCISKRLANALRLTPVAYVIVKTAGGSSRACKYIVKNIILPNKVAINNAVVYDADIDDQGIDVLIGMDIITSGDFSVSNFNKTVFSFRSPSTETIDFVQQELLQSNTEHK